MDGESDNDHLLKMDDDEKESLLPSKRPPLLNFSVTFEQLMFVIIMILPSLAPGMSVGYSAIALPELKLTLEESSWFASLPTVGGMLGYLYIGYFMDSCGRKAAFFANTIPIFIGYILLASSPKIFNLYLGMLCLGLAQSPATIVANAYIAESMVPNNLHFRSSLASWNTFAMTTGLALTYFLGYLLRYNYVALFGASLALISSILLLIFIPESPSWLDQRGRYEEAERARYLLGCEAIDTGSSTNYLPIEDNVKKRENFFTYLSKIRRKDVYKPLTFTLVYFFFQQFSGTQIYSAYMVDILTVNSIKIDSYLTTLICGIIMELGQIGYIILVPQLGLRRIAILSSVLGSSTTLILGICIHLNTTVTWYSQYVDYIHIFSIWCNVFVCALGIATIPYTIQGEIFPIDAKGFAAVPIFSGQLFYFINLWIFPAARVISPYAIFYFYAIIGFLTVPLIYFCMPETVGRTLQQISSNYSK